MSTNWPLSISRLWHLSWPIWVAMDAINIDTHPRLYFKRNLRRYFFPTMEQRRSKSQDIQPMMLSIIFIWRSPLPIFHSTTVTNKYTGLKRLHLLTLVSLPLDRIFQWHVLGHRNCSRLSCPFLVIVKQYTGLCNQGRCHHQVPKEKPVRFLVCLTPYCS